VSGSSPNTGVTWSAVSGTINPSSGLYTAPANVPAGGMDTVTATSNIDLTKKGTATVTITSGQSLSLSTNGLHLAYIEQPYFAVLTGVGGTPPYVWSLTEGALPSGLSLDSTTGQITGTPTVGGSFSVTFTATDANNATASKSFALTVFEQPLDQYGGLVNAPSPNGATGFFRTEKTAGGRWLLVSPAGNYMWLFSVYSVSPMDGGTNYQNVISAKYPSGVWQQQAVNRLKSWGFNAIGGYAAVGGSNVLPVSTYNNPANPVKVPFFNYLNPSGYCPTIATWEVKNVYNGTNPAVYSVGRSFPDVFDPNWQVCANAFANNSGNVFTPTISQTEPWMAGIQWDDGDYIFGFGGKPGHPHLGWIAAITAPTQRSGNGFTYSNTTVYMKQALQTYLEGKYSKIGRLNAAWGSNYTTFGSAGGWPKGTTGGTGLMDEDGTSPWLRTTDSDAINFTGPPPNVIADLNAVLGLIAKQYYSTLRRAAKTYYPNHLVVVNGGFPGNNPAILQQAGQYGDIIEMSAEPAVSLVQIPAAYSLLQKPISFWTTLTSQEDTEASAGTPWGTGACTEDYDFCTQALRGAGYQSLISNYWNTQASDGTYPVIGLDWWEWVDKVTDGENMNFGLVSQYDNAYDGLEDQTTAGADSWGYTTGSEPHNHGDFLGAVTQQNLDILRAVVTEP
jgi:hypothetical protein